MRTIQCIVYMWCYSNHSANISVLKAHSIVWPNNLPYLLLSVSLEGCMLTLWQSKPDICPMISKDIQWYPMVSNDIQWYLSNYIWWYISNDIHPNLISIQPREDEDCAGSFGSDHLAQAEHNHLLACSHLGVDKEYFDEDVDDQWSIDHANPLDADPVGDGEGDDEGGVGEDRQHVAQQPQQQTLAAKSSSFSSSLEHIR